MTNNELVVAAVIEHGLMTAEQVEAMAEGGLTPPFHTYNAWKDMGYQVRKGETALFKTPLWKYKARPTKKEQAALDSGELEPGSVRLGFYMAMSGIFSAEQVDKVEDK